MPLGKLQRKEVCLGSQFWPKVEGMHLVMAFLLAVSLGINGYHMVRDGEYPRDFT
jgi:hypothetical protein